MHFDGQIEYVVLTMNQEGSLFQRDIHGGTSSCTLWLSGNATLASHELKFPRHHHQCSKHQTNSPVSYAHVSYANGTNKPSCYIHIKGREKASGHVLYVPNSFYSGYRSEGKCLASHYQYFASSSKSPGESMHNHISRGRDYFKVCRHESINRIT